MSIKDRVNEAKILWDLGHKEGAWTLALIATAATAKKKYPHPMPDNESFKKFIRGIAPTIMVGKSSPIGTDVQVLFGMIPFEDIMYTHLRCCLVHEADLSEEVLLSESIKIGDKLEAKLVVGNPVQLPDFYVLNLINAIKEAPENSELF